MIRLILTLDHERSEELVGLISKALGRGEQGILAMEVETFEPHKVAAAARPAKDVNLKNLIKRLPEGEAREPSAPRPVGRPKRTPRPRVKSHQPAAEIIYNALKNRVMGFSALGQELEKHGFSPQSINTALKRARTQHPDIQRMSNSRFAPYHIVASEGPAS